MGTWTSSIPSIVEALAKRNGGRYDEKTPKMKVADMVAALGLYSSQLPHAIGRIAPIIAFSGFVDNDGILTISESQVTRITASEYLFNSVPAADVAWQRCPTRAPIGPFNTYEPARVHSLAQDDKLEHIGFLRQTLDDYQRASDQIANSITMYPFQVASAEICRSFMSALRALATDLEVMAENPPTTFAQDARAALGVALVASEQATVDLANAAASAAAKAANLAGQVAASAAEGFFSSANLVTLTVAVLVGYVAIGRLV
jgi:hypothetical protein